MAQIFPRRDHPYHEDHEHVFENDPESEALLDLGLDPHDPDYSELAPHGMSGDDNDDEDTEELGSIIEDYMEEDDRNEDHEDND